MIITMQGSWTVSVKSKSAAFPQRFVISGSATGHGVHAGTPGTSVSVTGAQWSIAIQNNPGTGFQLSDAQVKFPRRVGSHYEFEIWSNDAGPDQDFNDLILTCSRPATINSFIVFGNLSLYGRGCIFNPCRRRGPFVIETQAALAEALKNPLIAEALKQLYPDRVGGIHIPNPPDPPPFFTPMVIDPWNEAVQPRTAQLYKRVAAAEAKAKKTAAADELSFDNFEPARTAQINSPSRSAATLFKPATLAAIEGRIRLCDLESGPNITLSFEEYDRTAAEKAGGAYTGTGPRRMLGDTITDMNGNYIFHFEFGMTIPFLEDAGDIAPGEDVNVVLYPDVIVKVLGFSPSTVLYESAPYYNIPNIKRIDLCLPKPVAPATAACFNGNLIGSLGNVFLGGNQNTTASTSPALLQRYGDNNFLEAGGKITVHSGLAGFSAECAAWNGMIDMRGCLYDTAKTAADNHIKWYTIRVRREGTTHWQFVSENYKHPRFSNRNLPNYTGDDVGPFYPDLHVDGGSAFATPAYKNIQREIFVDGIDWEFADLDRYMQLHTELYDEVAGVTTPGTIHVRVDGYDILGNPVANATDMIALFIHNLNLNFDFSGPSFVDPGILNAGCGLFRLNSGQMMSPMQLSFRAGDPHGFVDSYSLSMGRCPSPTLALHFVQPPSAAHPDTNDGDTVLAQGNASANVQSGGCPGYRGTSADFGTDGMIVFEIQPVSPDGWIRPGEIFTSLSFTLEAAKRVTNGYNNGVSGTGPLGGAIYLERLP